jgi:hypothetical protein
MILLPARTFSIAGNRSGAKEISSSADDIT